MTVPEIPATQTAAWIINPGPNGELTIRDNVAVQQPGENEVLVKMEYSGICHSDCHNLKLPAGSYKEIPGHEGVGVVVKLGPNSPDSFLGKRVGIKWLWSACGKCASCKKGFHNNCPNQINTGKGIQGTLQQYCLGHSQFVTLIPDGVKSEVAAPLLCAGLSLAGAISKCSPEVRPGEWIAIIGAGGGLGHVGVQIAAKSRGYKVIAVDSGVEKENLCKEMGAEAFVDYAKENVVEAVRALTEGEGAQAVICVAGSERAYEQAPSLVRNNGVVVCVGIPPPTFMFPMTPVVIANRGLVIKGSSTGTSVQMDELLQDALAGRITPKIEVYDFAESPQIIQELMRYEVSGRKVVRVP